MGNLSCVSCQMRKSNKNTKNEPVAPQKQKPSTVSSAKEAWAETVNDDAADQSRLDDVRDTALSAILPSLPVSSDNVGNCITQSTMPVVESVGDDDKTKHVLDWLWEAVCRPRYECLSNETSSAVNSEIKQPDLELIAAAVVELNLYLASQVICPAIERHLAELNTEVNNTASEVCTA